VPASVLVVDDDAMFRVTVAWLLRGAGLRVVGEAASAGAAIAAARDLQPDAVLVDVELPDESGIVLAGKLARLPWQPRVVLISSNRDAAMPDDVQGSGALGFIAKEDLPEAPLYRVLAGDWP
jgi:DNA-binding NarL/FixJ family response regulator